MLSYMPDVNPLAEALQNSHEAVAARRNSTACVQRERDTEAARLAWTCTAGRRAGMRG